MTAGRQDARRYLVESYGSGLTEPRVVQAARRLQDAVRDLTSEGREITCVTTLFIPDDEVVFCVFDAGSVGAVEDAYRRGALPFDRILPVVQIEPFRGGEP
jgi:Protein of unknown function (DUF4242)